MNYRSSKAAKADLYEIIEYLRTRGSRKVAARVLRELREAIQKICDNPGIGHRREDLTSQPVRFYRVYKYLIIYREQSNPLLIVRILHGARDVRSLLG